MPRPICIRLPYLHKNFTRDMPNISRLCPCPEGQDDPEVFPAAWPLDREKAALFLHQLKNMDARDLDSLRHFFNRRAIAREYEIAAEMRSLSRFAQNERLSPNLEYANESEAEIPGQAQQILLWCWHMEELAIEISSLEKRCGQMENKLRQNFLEQNEGGADLSGDANPDLMPPWRICAANALLFLPANAYIYIEGAMRADILENFAFQPASLPGFDHLLEYRAPLWKILGHSRNNFSASGNAFSALEEAYGRERVWLARRDA